MKVKVKTVRRRRLDAPYPYDRQMLMDFRDSLSAELPAPRDDEPGGLRDDILDELADHLACAYRRELLRGADTATARQRVLKRFGDPAAVARRLWFDAMKGKIMAQRILVVCCILLTVISLSLAALMWNQAVHAQRLAAMANAEMADQMHRAQLLQQQMLAQLQAMSKETVHPKVPPEQVPVRVQCKWPGDDGYQGLVLNAFFVSRGQTDQGCAGEAQGRDEEVIRVSWLPPEEHANLPWTHAAAVPILRTLRRIAQPEPGSEFHVHHHAADYSQAV